MMSNHISFQKLFAPRRQYARGYRVVGALRVICITRTRMIEHERGAVAAIMHCAWHECGRADANDAAAHLSVDLISMLRPPRAHLEPRWFPSPGCQSELLARILPTATMRIGPAGMIPIAMSNISPSRSSLARPSASVCALYSWMPGYGVGVTGSKTARLRAGQAAVNRASSFSPSRSRGPDGSRATAR